MAALNSLQKTFRRLIWILLLVVLPITISACYFIIPAIIGKNIHAVTLIFTTIIVGLLFNFLFDVAQKAMMFCAIGFKVLGFNVRGGGCNNPNHKSDTIGSYTYDENGYYYYVKDPNFPTCVFLHGNAQPACCWVGFLEMYGFNHGYNIILVEFPGYGRRYPSTTCDCATLDTARDDISKQWSHFATNRVKGPMILMGLSLGGGFAWSTIDRLSPPPEQLVLLNTFSDLKIFIKHMVGSYFYPLAYSCLSKNLLNYDVFKLKDHTWKGKVLSVYTINDDLFHDGLHNELFRRRFKDELGCEWEEFRRPSGGHKLDPHQFPEWTKKVVYWPLDVKSKFVSSTTIPAPTL